MTNVYLVVPDVHLDFQKANRKDYFSEIIEALNGVLDIANRYKEKGNVVKLVLLGDVFDGSISNPSEAMHATEIFRFFCSNFDEVFSVVGNHEISFAKDNPFWFLVSDMEDISLSSIRRFIQPMGLSRTVRVPATVTEGNTVMYFNHYGTPAKVPTEGEVRIGFFHQNVGSNDICKMWGTFDDVEEASYIKDYHYSFFGHMHLARGEYYLNEQRTCKGIWLGTLGRTKVTEIDDDNLSVNIPAVVIKDGVFECVENNSVALRPFKACVDIEKYQAEAESRELVKEQKKNVMTAYTGDTLFDTVHGSLADTPLYFFLEFLDRPWEVVKCDYFDTLNNFLLDTESTSIAEREEDDADGHSEANE